MISTHAKTHDTGGTSTQPFDTDHAAIIALLHRLYDGLYHGDTAELRQTFHPDARYVTAAGEALLQLDVESYMDVVANRASPASNNEPYSGFDIESIELAGPKTACVRVRSSMLGKHFIDFLVLIKIDKQWCIISKVFHYTANKTHDSQTKGN